MSRSLIFQCEDWSNYWDYAYQWSNTDIFGPSQKAVFSGGATNLFTDFLSDEGSMLVAVILRGQSQTYPKMKGLAAGIMAMVEAIGGSYYSRPDEKGNEPKKYAGQNIFFSIAELRLHITQMMGMFENDPTSRNLLAKQGFDGMFGRAIGGLGEQVSIRQAITAVSKIIFHETYPQPCPLYKPGSGRAPTGAARIKYTDADYAQDVVGSAKRAIEELERIQSGLRDVESKTAAQEKELAAASSPFIVDSMVDPKADLRNLKLSLANVKDALQKAQGSFSTSRVPDVVRTIFSNAIRSLSSAVNNAPNWTVKAPTSTKALTEDKIAEALVQLRRMLDLTVNVMPLSARVPARLLQQIYRPDIWFGAPPRCNVLFPDMYENLTYQRMFLQEPTRFLLKTNDEFFGEDFLFDSFYFAPQAGSLKKDQANLMDVMRNDLLDHELFTGILPVFEKMGEFNIFASRSSMTTGGKVPKVSFAQRSANFIYFKYRFNARQLHVEGLFNPYVAVGFPGLILDRYIDAAASETLHNMREEFGKRTGVALPPKYTAELLGTNFLANFTEITHQVSQEQLRGHTSITCGYARQPDEGTEFLGVVEKIQTVQQRMTGDAKRTTDVACIDAPALYSIGPNGGRITGRQEVTDMYASDGVNVDSAGVHPSGNNHLPVFFGGSRRAGKPPGAVSSPSDQEIEDRQQQAFNRLMAQPGGHTPAQTAKLMEGFASDKKEGVGTAASGTYKGLEAPIGVLVTANDLRSAALADFLGDPYRQVVFRAFRIQEEVPRYKRTRVDLSAEDIIRPGWYGDIWASGQIGQVYQDFFGIGSISDATVILDSGNNSQPSASETFLKSVEESKATGTDPCAASAALPVVTSLAEGLSIEQAAEFLTASYSYVKQAGLDVDEFIRAYTWRPIATLTDMFGTEDLQFDASGVNVTSSHAVEGFHSRAFGPYSDLYGIVSPELEDVIGLKRGSTAAQRGDTRGRKREAVSAYVSALSFSKALLG
jgi:hypothetical protein